MDQKRVSCMIFVSYLQENKVKLGNHHLWIRDPEDIEGDVD